MNEFLVNIAKCAIDFAANCDCDVNRIELDGVTAFVYYKYIEDVMIPEGVKLYVENNGVCEEYDYCNSILQKIEF